MKEMIQFWQRDLQLLVSCIDTNRSQHFGMCDKYGSHQFLNIITPTIGENRTYIRINHILIPFWNFGTEPLKCAHRRNLNILLALFDGIVFRAKEFHKWGDNPHRQLL
jgi:hypothetical protein